MGGPQQRPQPRAVLFDRDGTLVEDVPYNGDPSRVRPVPTAANVLTSLRQQGIHVGVVTNQSGVDRGLLTLDQVRAVNARIEELLGSFGTWQICPHAPEAGCRCRKPKPGLVLAACAALGVEPFETVVIGDTGADVGAAHAAGARSVLVPNPVTLPAEIAAAPVVAGDLLEAVRIATDAAVPA
jgi:D-glycero-D-manno-heptose 1,7-bisphosphate phosphatase